MIGVVVVSVILGFQNDCLLQIISKSNSCTLEGNVCYLDGNPWKINPYFYFK